MKLTDIMTRELIQLELKGSTKEEVMGEMVGLLDQAGVLNDPKVFKDALNEREQQGSTGIGFGVAIPHGKSDAVKTPQVAFGLKKDGVNWDSLDGEDAKLIFMIAVPETSAGNEHLKILQMLSRKLIDDDFRTSLLQASSAEAVWELLSTI